MPASPEPYYKCTGHELQPRPVGEENGVVVFTYNPISAVNYVSAIARMIAIEDMLHVKIDNRLISHHSSAMSLLSTVITLIERSENLFKPQ